MAFVCLAFAVLIFPDPASGQLRRQTRYSRADVNGIIQRLENSSDRFRRDFDRAMDNSRLNGTSEEDRFNGYVRDFENQLDRLRNDFDRTDSWWEVRNQVQDVIRDAEPVNRMMNAIPFRRTLESQWTRMRNDINTLADTFDLPGINGGGWQGGGGGWGDGIGRTPPSWAQGDFYSNYPSISLTIDRNGRVSVVRDGQNFSGNYRANGFMMNGHMHTVTRVGNGIRTYNSTTGETVTYYRGTGGGGGTGGNRPPDWAEGDFYSNYPSISLTIYRDGRVTAVRDGQNFSGDYRSNGFMMNGQMHTVTRVGNGIRTYNSTTGESVTYYRGTGGGAGGGIGGVRPPIWAQGTFYSVYPSVTLTVTRNGQVTAVRDGQTYYGTYTSTGFTMNGHNHTVTRRTNGIRTYNRTTGETVDYSRR